MTIGLGLSLTVDEFNRRAMMAFRGVKFAYGARARQIVEACRVQLDQGKPLTPKQQQALYGIAHSYRRQISDAQVKDFAAERAHGAD